MSRPPSSPGEPPALARLVVRAGTRLAPLRHRERVRRQWEADLEHRWRRGGGALRTASWAMGVIPHALYLRRRERGMGGLAEDLGQAWRGLRRRPGPAALAVLVLGMGIGSAAAVFTVAEAVLVRPLPFPDGERLVRVYSVNREHGFERSAVSWPDFVDMRASGVLEGAGLYAVGELDLAGDAAPERVGAAEVDGGFFDALGASALAGRLPGPADQAAGGPPVVVLSSELWERRWGADPGVVGGTVRLDGVPHTVVGVLRREHAWPRTADVWVPFGWGSSPPEWVRERDSHSFAVVGRLAPGVDAGTATRRLSEVSRRARADLGPDDREASWEADVVPLHRSLVSADTPRLVLLAGLAVAGVLLIACMNVTSLLLVQARRRIRELSLRSALGAEPLRLVRQVLIESGLLALAGGAVGTGVSFVAIRAAAGRAPAELRHLASIEPSAPVLLAAVALSLIAAVAAGLGPALRAGRADVARALREGAGASVGRERRRGQRVLVVAELAITTVLLVASGLFVRSFQAQLAADPGFEAERVVTFSVVLPRGRYGEREEIAAFFDRASGSLRGLPGVGEVTVTSTTPLDGGGLQLVRAFLPEGAPEPPAGPEQVAQWVEVDPAYFRTLGIAPLRGRSFSAEDGPGAEPVMIVTPRLAEALAEQAGTGDALGMRVRSWRDEDVHRRVVGVVPRPRLSDIGDSELPIVFVPRSQSVRGRMSVLLRVDGDPAGIAPAIRDRVADIDPDLAVPSVSTLEAVRRRDLAPLRFLAALFSAFGAGTLLLAVTGVYGLVAFSVATRAREIGIRMAIGATRGEVRGTVMGEGAALAAIGLLLGAAGGALFARATASVLDGVAWLDGPTWAGALVILGAATLAATLVPALRASRIDPVRTLGVE